VLTQSLCEVGLWLGSQQGGDQAQGVDGGGVVDKQRGREALAGFCPRAALPLLDAKPKMTRGLDLRIPWTPEGNPPADPHLSLWSVWQEKKERERC
jgi:hypothetical protein